MGPTRHYVLEHKLVSCSLALLTLLNLSLRSRIPTPCSKTWGGLCRGCADALIILLLGQSTQEATSLQQSQSQASHHNVSYACQHLTGPLISCGPPEPTISIMASPGSTSRTFSFLLRPSLPPSYKYVRSFCTHLSDHVTSYLSLAILTFRIYSSSLFHRGIF